MKFDLVVYAICNVAMLIRGESMSAPPSTPSRALDSSACLQSKMQGKLRHAEFFRWLRCDLREWLRSWLQKRELIFCKDLLLASLASLVRILPYIAVVHPD